MTKVIIDSFDTEEQAVAFVAWFKKHTETNGIKLLTTEGLQEVEWDGVDLYMTNKQQIVVNIVMYDVPHEDDY